jgi:hypothetical protein
MNTSASVKAAKIQKPSKIAPQQIDLLPETSVYRGSVQLSENAKAHVLNGLPSRSRGHG